MLWCRARRRQPGAGTFANGNTAPEVPLLNETGAPLYVHWDKDCKQPPQGLLSGDELNGVSPNSASIYIPPLG
jgi:hypothetical protein